MRCSFIAGYVNAGTPPPPKATLPPYTHIAQSPTTCNVRDATGMHSQVGGMAFMDFMALISCCSRKDTGTCVCV